MFKSTDKKLEEIGFKKVKEDKWAVVYERYNDIDKYMQVLTVVHKTDGNNIIQSYDKDTFDKHFMGNICVGLTGYETKLILKKMKQLGWYSK
nr:MAG TPA: hypothetical protein [Caudoviricetes sp.]